MTSLNEARPRRMGPLQRQLLQDAAREDEALMTNHAFDSLFQKMCQYVHNDPGLMKTVMSTADSLDLWYETIFRRRFPQSPVICWDLPTSQQLATVLCQFLFYKFEHTRGRHHTGKITRRTLKGWGRQVLYLAGYHILGAGSHGKGRNPRVARGQLEDRSDSLFSMVLKNFVPLLIRENKLPTKVEERQFWGADELALVCLGLDDKIISQPGRAFPWLQAKSFEQMSLAIGTRTGSSTMGSFVHSGNVDAYIKERDITVYQTAQNVYNIELNFEYLKGFSTEQHESVDFHPVVPACTKPGNVQLEFATSILPLLVHRGALYALRGGTKVFFTDIDMFLKAKDSQFYGDTAMPLFRAFTSKGEVAPGPLKGHNANIHLRSVALEVNLDNPRHHNWRRGVGDIALTGFGPEAQAAVLNHGSHNSVGRTHYSHGPGNYPVASAMMGELDTLCAEVRQRLETRHATWRRTSTPAIRALARTYKEGAYERGMHAPDRATVAAQLAQIPEYAKLEEELENMSQAVANVTDPIRTLKAMEGVRHKMWRIRNGIQTHLNGANKRAVLRSRGTKVDMTVSESTAARLALDMIRESSGLLLHALKYPGVTMSSFLEAQWPKTESTDDENIEEEDDEDANFVHNPNHGSDSDLTMPVASTSSTMFVRGARNQAPLDKTKFALDGEYDEDSDSDDDANDEQAENKEDNAFGFVVWSDAADDKTNPPSTVELRTRLIRANFDLLKQLVYREDVLQFVQSFGYCPLCPLHAVGFALWMPTHNYNTYKLWRTVGILGTGDFKQHLRKVHPADWGNLRRGGVPPTRSGFTLSPLSNSDVDVVASHLEGEGLPEALQAQVQSHNSILLDAPFTDDELDKFLKIQNEFDDAFIFDRT